MRRIAEALAMNADPPERAAVDRIRIASIVAMGPRLAAVITHDGQPIADAAFHPTKEQLATVGRDRRLRMWAVPTDELIFMTEPFHEPPSQVQFAPDGQRILVVSSEFNQAGLLSVSNGALLAEPIPHLAGGANNRPLPPRFDEAGKLLLTQSALKTVRVWSSVDASPLGPAIALSAPIAWMNFSKDGAQVLTITQDARATTWDWRTGVLYSLSSSRGEGVQKADVATLPSFAPTGGEGVRRTDEGADGFPTGFQTAVFSPDKTKLATTSAHHRAQVWSADNNEPLTPPIDHNVATGPIEFSASRRFLLTIHPAHAVYVWDLSQTNEPPVLLRPGAPHGLAESGQDGSVFVTRDPNSPIRVRALAAAAEVSLHPSSLKRIPVQAWFDETGQFIILEGEKQHAQIWDAATGLPVTPTFPSRYATNEADYLNIRFARITNSQLPPSLFELRRTSRPPTSDLRSLAELLSGSRLDGTGGWKPLELGEIVERWNVNEIRERISSQSLAESQ